MQIVIGTRTWLGPDWTHVDASPNQLDGSDGKRYPVDIVCDAKTIPLPSECASLVYSQECLEHFPRREYFQALMEWARLVKLGGKIHIEVPDFLAACEQVLVTDSLEMDRAIQQIIFGGQENKWDFHYMGFTPRMLTEDLEALGFKIDSMKRGWEAGYLQAIATKVNHVTV